MIKVNLAYGGGYALPIVLCDGKCVVDYAELFRAEQGIVNKYKRVPLKTKSLTSVIPKGKDFFFKKR